MQVTNVHRTEGPLATFGFSVYKWEASHLQAGGSFSWETGSAAVPRSRGRWAGLGGGMGGGSPPRALPLPSYLAAPTLQLADTLSTPKDGLSNLG